MKTCNKCKRSNILDRDIYCPNCGSKDLAAVVLSSTGVLPASGPDPAAASSTVVLRPAGRIQRLLAGFIDGVVVNFILLATLIPVINVFATLGAGAFILLRDMNERSAGPGKRLVGLHVATKSGGKPTGSQQILRNFVFVIPMLVGFIPFLAYFDFLDDALFFLEAALIFVMGSRLGDWIAGTVVVSN
jgi:uncharacterized RDD family membrane protein YckC